MAKIVESRTALSIPSVISMMKNIMDQAVDPGSVAMASGYTMNTNPGPAIRKALSFITVTNCKKHESVSPLQFRETSRTKLEVKHFAPPDYRYRVRVHVVYKIKTPTSYHSVYRTRPQNTIVII